jgi:hypothetical protein
MDATEKKMAAALAAVTAYLQQEEECLPRQMAAAAPCRPCEEICSAQPLAAAQAQPGGQTPPAQINLWGLSGRQSMMQLRNQMQLKGFHRIG